MQGVWADPTSKDTALVFQAWGVLEARNDNPQLARELFKCAVKADPRSQISWQVNPVWFTICCDAANYTSLPIWPVQRTLKTLAYLT